jgi:hypothetical protein
MCSRSFNRPGWGRLAVAQPFFPAPAALPARGRETESAFGGSGARSSLCARKGTGWSVLDPSSERVADQRRGGAMDAAAAERDLVVSDDAGGHAGLGEFLHGPRRNSFGHDHVPGTNRKAIDHPILVVGADLDLADLLLEGEEPLRREKNADSTIQVSRGFFACPHCSETFLHRIWRFNGWKWWEDLRHMVTEHGMKVDAEFEKFIANEIKWSAQKTVKLEKPPGR